MDGTYYTVSDGSPVMTVIREFEQKYREFRDAVEAMRVKHGAKEAFTYGRRGFAGLKFEGETPKGWRKRNDGICVPDSRCKAGKQIKKEVRNMPSGWDAWTFSSALGEGFIYFGDGAAWFSAAMKFGDKYVLRVPSASKVVPEGCTELKMSEYWALREAAGCGGEESEAA